VKVYIKRNIYSCSLELTVKHRGRHLYPDNTILITNTLYPEIQPEDEDVEFELLRTKDLQKIMTSINALKLVVENIDHKEIISELSGIQKNILKGIGQHHSKES
jgi:hypothetical protein